MLLLFDSSYIAELSHVVSFVVLNYKFKKSIWKLVQRKEEKKKLNK